jgi:hypothetical protein
VNNTFLVLPEILKPADARKLGYSLRQEPYSTPDSYKVWRIYDKNGVEVAAGQLRVSALRELRKYILSTPPEVYVEYVSQRSYEDPFELNGQRWQYVNVKNSRGQLDIGVYSFSEDRCYNYSVWRSRELAIN